MHYASAVSYTHLDVYKRQAQDGRRGALMLTVSINHPDSESFIHAKMTEGKVTGANVSVRIDDAFMQAVVDDKEYVPVSYTHLDVYKRQL